MPGEQHPSCCAKRTGQLPAETYRQENRRTLDILAGVLEVGHELAAAVDLQGSQRERQRVDQVHQEAPGIAGGCARVDPRHHEPRHGTDRSELLERLPVGGAGHVVHLHQFAALAGPGAVLPAPCPFGEAAPSPGLHAAFAEGRGADRAGPERALEDPPDRGHAQLPALACQHGLDARLAHERVLAAHVQDCLDVPRLPGALPHAAGTRRLRRQPALAAGGQRDLPPVQRAPADPDMRQRTRLVAAGVPQTAIRAQCPIPLRRLRRHVFVNLEAAIRSDAHGLHVHGSGLHSSGFGCSLEATRSGAAVGVQPPRRRTPWSPLRCQMCLS